MATYDAEIADLIPLARAGDAAALGRLLDIHRDYLRRLAGKKLTPKLRGRLDGSDIVQQTCLSVQKQIGGFVGSRPAEFVAWLRQIHERNIRNVIRSHLRAQKRAASREESLEYLDLVAQDAESKDIVVREEQAMRLRSAMELLPFNEREVIRLRYFDGWTLPQICEKVGLSTDAVVWLIRRSMKRLKNHL